MSEKVDTFDSFLKFLKAMEKDRKESVKLEAENLTSPYEPDAGGWENTSIEDFLESMRAWLADSQDKDVSPSWELFAEAIMAGKTYE